VVGASDLAVKKDAEYQDGGEKDKLEPLYLQHTHVGFV
jgi:hypothetical protein